VAGRGDPSTRISSDGGGGRQRGPSACISSNRGGGGRQRGPSTHILGDGGSGRQRGLVSPPCFPVGLQWILPDSTGFHWTPLDSMFGGSPYKVSGLDWIFSPVESGRIHWIFSPVGLYQTESPVKSSGIHWTGSS